MKIRRLLVPALLGLCVSAASYAQGNAPVAKVNGVTIPQSRLEMLVRNAGSQGQPDSPELRSRIRDELITREILVQEATKKGIEKDPEVAAQIDFQRQGVLINAFLREHIKTNPVTEDSMKKEYEAAKSQAPAREYKLHHILVKQEEDAKQIIAQLKKGANFQKLAAEKSEDQGSKTRGGDLDWGPANRYVKPFSDAVAKLKKGQITDTPVQTQYGWHVIRLDDERAARIPPYEEVKGSIQQQMQNQAAQKAIADLRAKAKVE